MFDGAVGGIALEDILERMRVQTHGVCSILVSLIAA